MSTAMQLSELITATRQRADMVNSQFVSDSEVTSYINQSYFELYDLLIQKFGDNYYVAPQLTITTDGVNSQFALPDGSLYSNAPAFYKMLGVDLVLNTNVPSSAVRLEQFDFNNRNDYGFPNVQAFGGASNLRYRINGSKIWFSPLPSANQSIGLWYIPRMTTLSTGTDAVDGVSGWTEYIIIDAAIKCLQKEESDVSVLAVQKGEMIKRIEAAAENRDAGSPPTVADVVGAYPWLRTGSGWGAL